jgi:hypothetical protein
MVVKKGNIPRKSSLLDEIEHIDETVPVKRNPAG